MALQASAPGELRGALGRLGYLCAEGGKAMFVVSERRSLAAGPSVHVSARWLHDRRTQYMSLSASIMQRLICGAHRGP